MTRGPRRLREDTDFVWETGCQLADEELVVGDYDHDRVRSKLLAAVALVPATELSVGDGMPSIRPSGSTGGAARWAWSGLRPVVAAFTGAAVVAGAYWLGVQAGNEGERTRVEPDPLPIEATLPAPPGGTHEETPAVEPVPAPIVPQPSPETVQAPEAQRAPSIPTAGTPTAGTPTAGTPTAGTPGTSEGSDAAGGVPVVRARPPESAPPTKPVSRFAQESDAFGAARDALDVGHFDHAHSLFTAYLDRFPDGSMRPEAELGRLEAVRGTGDFEALAALAARVQDMPALSGRREEIVRLRAESLVELGRCDEAVSLTRDVSSRVAANIRRTCRSSHRE